MISYKFVCYIFLNGGLSLLGLAGLTLNEVDILSENFSNCSWTFSFGIAISTEKKKVVPKNNIVVTSVNIYT